MCFLLQVCLFLAASLVLWLISGLLHAPLWLGGIGGGVVLVVAWFGYLVFQARHPDWWAPWDDGLPQEMRMTNAFVPVWMVFVLLLLFIPTAPQVRQQALARHRKVQRIEQRRKIESYAPSAFSTNRNQ
jgi:zinc transporter ZupT